MTYRQLLKQNPTVRTLWFAALVSEFGSWFSTVAIYTLLLSFGASPLIIAAAAAFHWLPGALQAPIAGVIVDRSNTKPLMLILIAIELITTLMLLLITSPSHVWLLLILLFIRMGAASMFFTAQMALLPSIVSEDELRTANDINAITWSFTFISGMALGGIAVEYLGITAAILIDALTFVIALLILTRLMIAPKPQKAYESTLTMIKEGYAYLKAHPTLIPLILFHASIGFTAFDALVTLLANQTYATIIAIPLAIGYVNAIRAIGLMLGPFLFQHIKDTNRLLLWLFPAQGFAILLWSYTQQDFYVSLIGMFLTGLFTAPIWSITYSMIQSSIEPQFYGRVIAYNDMTFLLANALVSLFIGGMASGNLFMPLELISATLGSLFLLTGFWYWRVYSRIG